MKIINVKTNLFIFIGLIIFSFAFFVFAEDNSQSQNNIFMDSDQDGLSNEEEKSYGTDPNNPDTDGDGYSDGAEVKSGYDPLKPAPGDKIIESKKTDEAIPQVLSESIEKTIAENGDQVNLTQELSAKVVDLVNTKSTNNENINIDDLSAISEQLTLNTSVTLDDLPEIDESTIKIKKQDYSKLSQAEKTAKINEDNTAYLVAVAYILANNAPQKISTLDDLTKIGESLLSQADVLSSNLSLSFLDDYMSKGTTVLEQIQEVEVPEDMLDFHKKGLALANYSINLKKDIEASQNKQDDPVATMLKLSKLQNLIDLALTFSNDVNSKLNILGISTIPIDLSNN